MDQYDPYFVFNLFIFDFHYSLFYHDNNIVGLHNIIILIILSYLFLYFWNYYFYFCFYINSQLKIIIIKNYLIINQSIYLLTFIYYLYSAWTYHFILNPLFIISLWHNLYCVIDWRNLVLLYLHYRHGDQSYKFTMDLTYWHVV